MRAILLGVPLGLTLVLAALPGAAQVVDQRVDSTLGCTVRGLTRISAFDPLVQEFVPCHAPLTGVEVRLDRDEELVSSMIRLTVRDADRAVVAESLVDVASEEERFWQLFPMPPGTEVVPGATYRAELEVVLGEGYSWWSIAVDSGCPSYTKGIAYRDGDVPLVFTDFLFRTYTELPVHPGNVNAGVGAVADVLFVNGSSGAPDRRVTLDRNEPFSLELTTAPLGPRRARYALWIWPGCTSSPREIRADGKLIGSVVNPTPLHVGELPQPIRCLSGGLSACGTVAPGGGPARAPWVVDRPNGLDGPLELSIQGVIADFGSGAPDPLRFSVTNAVILEIR